MRIIHGQNYTESKPQFTAEYSYYDNAAIKAMAEIESLTGKIFHESHPDLQADFEQITAMRVLPRLKKFVHRLMREIDSLNGI